MSEPGTSEVDLTNCDREPIHVPGSIQEHGCLLVCDLEAVRIRRHSANAAAFLGLAEGEALNDRALEDVIGAVPVHELRNALARSGIASRAGLMPGMRLQPSGRSFDVAVHRFGGNAILEFEKPAAGGASSPLEFTRTLVGRLHRRDSLTGLAREAARLLRAVLQYDRVMIYRFAEDGSGQVISEARRAMLESFLGQHFPASDIPQQARRLYLLNPIRVVSNAAGTRIPIVPTLDGKGEELDMSHAHLRSVSPIHCEYLRNMGVAASMSISIIVDGALWGLVACHHYSPRSLSMSQRVAAEIFGQFLALHVETLMHREKLTAAARTRSFFDRLLAGRSAEQDPAKFLVEHLSSFRELLPCDGVGFWLDGAWHGEGSTPPPAIVPALADLAAGNADGGVWATHELCERFPPMRVHCEAAAGVLAVPLSRSARDYLFFFRREVVQTLEWGGDPHKTYETGPLGDRLTPRQSFAIWKQTVEGQSHRWGEIERGLAESIRITLMQIVLRRG